MTTPENRPAVLVTGSSSGIGKATAARLARGGRYTVYATARRPDSIAELESVGARLLALDVTDAESMRAAVDKVVAEHGAVHGLVNNAGYGEYGAVEEVDLDRVRAMFETNVFGLARMCQLVLPGMRAQGAGRIVNISSMGGRLVFPVGGYYHASKYAVEAISDALRFEVRRFGVRVSVVEPGLIRTGFGSTATSTLDDHADRSGPYAPLSAAVEKSIERGYANTMVSAPPESVAKVVDRALTSRSPRTRYVVTGAARAMVTTRRLIPGAAWDGLLRAQYRG